jgi:hypothetical protein
MKTDIRYKIWSYNLIYSPFDFITPEKTQFIYTSENWINIQRATFSSIDQNFEITFQSLYISSVVCSSSIYLFGIFKLFLYVFQYI